MGAAADRPQIIYKEIEAKYKELNDGEKCPIMGLGTALIKKDEDIDVVYISIKDGVRLIDTEPKNEILVGKGIQKAIKEKIVRREDLFIVTKLELDEKEDPEQALENSLKRLNLNYVDLYLDHWPSCVCINNPEKKIISVRDTWEKMEKLVDKKLTKSIGVSNYNAENLFNVLSICKIKPVVNEVEFNILLFQKDLKVVCDKEKIVLFAYNPFAKGEYAKRSKNYQNLLMHPIINNLKKQYETYYKNKKDCPSTITEGQIILNWHLSLGVVPIPGTHLTTRMKDNLLASKFTMKKDFCEIIGSDNANFQRFNDGSDIFGINIFA